MTDELKAAVARSPGNPIKLAFAWSLAFGCAYVPPTMDQPHATVEFRRVYESRHHTAMKESLRIDNRSVHDSTGSVFPDTKPMLDTYLVHPVPAEIAVESVFFHTEMERVRETYYVTVSSQENEAYDCSEEEEICSNVGSKQESCHTQKLPRTCWRTVWRDEKEKRYRWVDKAVSVVDARCKAEFIFAPEVGGTYTIELTLRGQGRCHISCTEQWTTPDGEREHRSCSLGRRS